MISGILKPSNFGIRAAYFVSLLPGPPDFCADPRWIPLDTGFESLFCVPPATKKCRKGPQRAPAGHKRSPPEAQVLPCWVFAPPKTPIHSSGSLSRVPRRAPMCTRRIRNVASWSPIQGGCTATLFKLNLAVRTTVANIFWPNPLHKAGGRRPPLFRPCIYIYIYI